MSKEISKVNISTMIHSYNVLEWFTRISTTHQPNINYNDLFCADMKKVKEALAKFQLAWDEWQEI